MDIKKYDLIVVGGGFSGVAAAISAARSGLKVLIADKSNSFGGAAANSLVCPFMPYKTVIDGEAVKLSRGIFEEISEQLSAKNKFVPDGNDIFFDDEYLKLILNRMVIEAGAEILFGVYLTDVTMDNGSVKSVTFSSKSGSFDVEADYFIDATGDAGLAYLAGYPYHVGREEDGLCQPMTLCFRLGNVDESKINRKEICDLYQEKQQIGEIKNPREDVLFFKTLTRGVVHFNTTRIVKHNPTDVFDVTKAEIEVREQVYEVYEFLKENFEAFKDSSIIMTAPEIGIRESRMIDGEYLLTAEDLLNLTQFDDSIALGNYDMDIHNPEGAGTSHHYFKQGEFYSIPYRSLIPKNSKNLLVAGRCISATHEAQASIRIMPIVCCLGHAAGEAIAVASKNKKNVKEIDIKELQAQLEKNGAVFKIPSSKHE